MLCVVLNAPSHVQHENEENLMKPYIGCVIFALAVQLTKSLCRHLNTNEADAFVMPPTKSL